MRRFAVNRDSSKLKKLIEKWGAGGMVVVGVYKHYPSVRSEGVNYHYATRAARRGN
jgi:hypothetical protein